MYFQIARLVSNNSFLISVLGGCRGNVHICHLIQKYYPKIMLSLFLLCIYWNSTVFLKYLHHIILLQNRVNLGQFHSHVHHNTECRLTSNIYSIVLYDISAQALHLHLIQLLSCPQGNLFCPRMHTLCNKQDHKISKKLKNSNIFRRRKYLSVFYYQEY